MPYHTPARVREILLDSKSRQNRRVVKARVDVSYKTAIPKKLCFAQDKNSDMEYNSVSDQNELSHGKIADIMRILKENFGDQIAGLQDPGLGQCITGQSLPRFECSGGRRFVQIVNVGDHWICLTNMFTSKIKDVYVYDSMNECISPSTVIQVNYYNTIITTSLSLMGQLIGLIEIMSMSVNLLNVVLSDIN